MKGTIQATAQKRTGVKPEGGRVPRWLQQAVLAWMFFAAFGVQRTQTISAVGSTGIPAISHTCDDNSKRLTRTKAGTTDTFGWDDEPRREGSAAVDSPEANPEGDRAAGSSRSQNRLVSLTKQSTGGTGTYSWMYDYRTRRVSFTKDATTTDITFSGGVSVGESENGSASVGYVRGSDWGGGVGGILYTVRAGGIRYNHYNTRGDVVVQMNGSETTTYAAQYKAFGDRSETGSSPDRQRSNTKDEDIPGYSNEGHRFRDLETGFISRDPAGFVDGPNLYAYVRQNPWTSFDPDGLKRVENRVEKKPVDTPKKPKRSDYKGDEKGWNNALKEHRAAEKTAKDNAEHNWRYATEIKAWENYDKVQSMAAGSSAMQQMNGYLDQEKITINGKEYNLIVNVNMKGMVGKSGEVSPGEVQGDNYVIDMDLSKSHFTSSSLFSDVVGANGQVPWHTLPHETYHAVEAAGIGSNPMRGIDPLGMGTTRSGDGNQVLIPGTKLPPHEARATRAGNIVASQTGHTTFSTGYGSKEPNAPAIPVPGYAPQ